MDIILKKLLMLLILFQSLLPEGLNRYEAYGFCQELANFLERNSVGV